ncbi:hypothetical protein V6N11_008171 [Hibiscus sabdariffa]|uniref:Heparanase-like protein 1 n=1 Tax=Hibiscus sabdariffa TaxID=183260 RepID=A0ABR2Q0G9_9ROSI
MFAVVVSGVDPKLISKILNPDHLNKASYTFGNLTHVIQRHGPWSSAWVGESGGASNSGGAHVSNTFVNSFCALLWHRLMGKVVLSVESDASPFLRSYAHCSKGRAGVTLLVINLSNQTNFVMNVQNSINLKLAVNEQNISQGSFTHTLKKTFSWVGTKASDEALFREEYHLTPKDDYLQSQTMVLNGIPLEFTDAGNIPSLDPFHVNLKSPISISPLSIAFIVFPNFEAPACG